MRVPFGALSASKSKAGIQRGVKKRLLPLLAVSGYLKPNAVAVMVLYSKAMQILFCF